ncbi:MAG: YhbY family RNA-binding protein [Zetaproteobacteria bacterium]|nr:YhbY family RNA-binding protein [Zetaproteobacteria bacterium]
MAHLDKKTLKKMKGIGYGLNPAVMVGRAGVQDNIFKAFELGFSRSEVVKAKIAGVDKEEFLAIAKDCAQRTQSELIHTIGRTALFFRENLQLRAELG